MENFYTVTFTLLAAISGLLELSRRGETKHFASPDFLRFRSNYIWVYALMMGTTSSATPQALLSAYECLAKEKSNSKKSRPVLLGILTFRSLQSFRDLLAKTCHRCLSSRTVPSGLLSHVVLFVNH